MVVAHNLTAMNSNRQFKINTGKKSKTAEKLASGYRINRAADDAAGLAISEKMRKQIRGLQQGVQNTQDGISLCQVADGALAEVSDILHRITELSIQASNDTYSLRDKQAIQEEINEILNEIDRIGDTTEFNGRKILNDGELASSVKTEIASSNFRTNDVSLKLSRISDISLLSTDGNNVISDFVIDELDNSYHGGYSYYVWSDCPIEDKIDIELSADSTGIWIGDETYKVKWDDINIGSSNNGKKTYDLNINNVIKISFDAKDTATIDEIANELNGKKLQFTIEYDVEASFQRCNQSDTSLGMYAKFSKGMSWDVLCELSDGVFDRNAGNYVYYFKYIKDDNNRIGLKYYGYYKNSTDRESLDIPINSTTNKDIVFWMTDESWDFIKNYDYSVVSTGMFVNPVYMKYKDSYIVLNIKNTTVNGGIDKIYDSLGLSGDSKMDITLGLNILANPDSQRSYPAILRVVDKEKQKEDVGNTPSIPNTSDKINTAEDTNKNGVNKEHGKSSNKGIWIQSGAEKNDGMYLRIDPMNSTLLGIDKTDITTSEGATKAMEDVTKALNKLSRNRSRIGAQQNRLEHTVANENNIIENTTSAESRIRDTDMAKEMVKLSMQNILEQANTSIMAQTNQSNQGVLSLLNN